MLPKSSRAADEHLAILLDEICSAVAWNRPSILVAVHHSRSKQGWAIATLEGMLGELPMEVEHVKISWDQSSILPNILQSLESERTVYFVQGLGDQRKIHNELNLHREKIIENCLKIVFWLSVQELAALSHRAPDFWAFRHRVVEFPAYPGSRQNRLPAGTLLWNTASLPTPVSLNEQISSQEEILLNLPATKEAALAHAGGACDLARWYWLKGENQKAEALLLRELATIGTTDLKEMSASLINGLTISHYDRGASQEALRFSEQALELQPDSGLLWANHGIVCQIARQRAKALPSVRKAVRLATTSSPVLAVLGYVLMSMGKYPAALSPLEQALSLNPDQVTLQFALAVCHDRIGDLQRVAGTLPALSGVSGGGSEPYLAIYREGLFGNRDMALNRLKDLFINDKIPSVFIRRDPTLHFIFGAEALASSLQEDA